MITQRIGRWFDDRLGASRFARESLNKVFPDQWSFMLGEIALYCFVVLVLSGLYLTFFYVPSPNVVHYHGSYEALRGVRMSQAYESTVRISFDVRAGMVMRQMHHWAALVFIAAIVAHLCRIFFTGAFRRPREINWIVGVTLLILAIFNGFAGYSLPDDLLSGTGLRIAYSIALSIPVIGTWVAFLIFGGEFPADDILPRLFITHVLIIPAAIAALLSIHLAVIWHQKHTQFRGRGRREDNVVGSQLWPTYAAKSIGLFALVAGVLALLGGLAQINPIWQYGPFEPAAVTTAAQPDWYLGWVEGALRIMPPVYLHVGSYSVSEIFWPAVVLPGLTFALLYAWPFLEAFATRDHAEHHLLDRPSERPVRTAIGVGVLAFYATLLLAGAQDLWSQHLGISLDVVLWSFRVLVFVLPVALGLFTWKLCHDLEAGRHAAHEEARAELPIAPSEEPIEPEPSEAVGGRAPEPPRAGVLRRVVDLVFGVVILVILRRRGPPSPTEDPAATSTTPESPRPFARSPR
jgi:ubiquinol-cytochrome c reductase cytochrome b subunit